MCKVSAKIASWLATALFLGYKVDIWDENQEFVTKTTKFGIKINKD